MTTPEQHTAEIARRDRLRVQGQRAAAQLEALAPVFAGARDDAIRQLVQKTIEDREIAADSVWELVALHRLEQKMRQKIAQGEQNAKKLSKMAEMARGELNG